MKKTAASVIATLLLSLSIPATAGGWERHDRHDRHEWRDHREHRHHNHHRPSRDAWAWGAAGLALGSAAAIVLSSPTPPAPPPRVWHYCDAYGAYYPNVQFCPGGWRAVSGY